jgi:hypothetical protein
VLVVTVLALSIGGGPAPSPAREAVRTETPAEDVRARRATDREVRRQADAVQRGRAAVRDAEARARLRTEILRNLEARGIDVDTPDPRRADDPEPPAAGGEIRDRTGSHPVLAQRLNADFMPLADECIEQARERMPELRGLVAIEVELLAEKSAGAIVESAAPAAINEIADPELLECLQETLLSLALPGEAVDGREALMISLRTDAG